MNDLKVSVVIPNLNGAGWLKQSIETIYAQTCQQFELIIVDNASTDESLQIAQSYQDRQNYTLIQNQKNTGFSFAVNQGIKIAKAPYVLLFNNDAFAQPDFIQNLLQEIEKDDKIFAVQSFMIQHYNRHLADDAGDYVTILGWACKRGDGLPVTRYTKKCRIFSACGGASMYRKSILDEIGLFDENFFAYLEDVDISWRANSLGYKNIFCPNAKCYHICGATTGGAQGAKYNDFKSIQSGRNNILLPYKNMPILMFIFNLPFLLFGYGIKTLFFCLRGYAKPYLKGAKQAFSTFKKIQKPKFRFKNIPNYIMIEFWMFADMFRYVDYRIRRLFTK